MEVMEDFERWYLFKGRFDVLSALPAQCSEKPCTSEVNWRDEAEDKEEDKSEEEAKAKAAATATPVGSLCPAALRFASAGCRLPPLVGGRGYIRAFAFGVNAGERSEGEDEQEEPSPSPSSPGLRIGSAIEGRGSATEDSASAIVDRASAIEDRASGIED